MGLNQSPDTSSKEQTLLNDSNIYFIYNLMEFLAIVQVRFDFNTENKGVY
ncbi:hypothetical protein [Priestia megaterium]